MNFIVKILVNWVKINFIFLPIGILDPNILFLNSLLAMKLNNKVCFLIGLSVVLMACERNLQVINDDITSLIYTLTSEDESDIVTLVYEDIDGLGGMPPNIIVDTLNMNTFYRGNIRIFDEGFSPPKDVTYLINDIPEDYQFFYLTADSTASTTYTDLDYYGYPVGLTTNFVTATSDGNLRIILRKDPDKSSLGVSDGDVTNAVGRTELEISFPIYVK
jgi:hypothetical protein